MHRFDTLDPASGRENGQDDWNSGDCRKSDESTDRCSMQQKLVWHKAGGIPNIGRGVFCLEDDPAVYLSFKSPS